MANQPLVDSLGELNAAARKYIRAQIDLLKVQFLEKLIRIGTYFFSVITMIISIAFILFSLTFAFSFWYGSQYGSLSEGFLISAAFYLVVTLLVYIFRKPLFANNIVRNLGNILFSEENKDD